MSKNSQVTATFTQQLHHLVNRAQNRLDEIRAENEPFLKPLREALDRDLNAAINIRDWGLRQYQTSTGGTPGIDASGDTKGGRWITRPRKLPEPWLRSSSPK